MHFVEGVSGGTMIRCRHWLWAAHSIHRRRRHVSTVAAAVQATRERLARAGLPSSDAKSLVAAALAPPLGSGNEVFLHMDRRLESAEAVSLESMLGRRCQGEPLAYVLGCKEFWSLRFRVTSDTLIPRSDSEVLIEALSELYPRECPLRMLDIGTGSGCLLLSALSEYPRAIGTGLDLSPGAVRVARENAKNLGLAARAEFIEFDMEQLPHLDPTRDGHGGPATLVTSPRSRLSGAFDVVICNPPYIPLSEVGLIAPDVLAFEPHGALFAEGSDALQSRDGPSLDADPRGLRFYGCVRDGLPLVLDRTSRYPPAVVLEVGSEEQAHAVRGLFRDPAPVRFRTFLYDAAGRMRGLVLGGP